MATKNKAGSAKVTVCVGGLRADPVLRRWIALDRQLASEEGFDTEKWEKVHGSRTDLIRDLDMLDSDGLIVDAYDPETGRPIGNYTIEGHVIFRYRWKTGAPLFAETLRYVMFHKPWRTKKPAPTKLKARS